MINYLISFTDLEVYVIIYMNHNLTFEIPVLNSQTSTVNLDNL